MGRIFTGQGKAFVKEEDLNEEVVSLSKSDIKKIIKDPQDIDYMSGENVKPMDVMRALK